jgi:hypothetical protein
MSTHSNCRCPGGRISTFGAATGIIVATRRRGPLPPRLRGEGGRRRCVVGVHASQVHRKKDGTPACGAFGSSGCARRRVRRCPRNGSPADVYLPVRCLPEARGLLLLAEPLHLACGGAGQGV